MWKVFDNVLQQCFVYLKITIFINRKKNINNRIKNNKRQICHFIRMKINTKNLVR